MASGSEDHTVQLWNVATGQLLHTLASYGERVTGLAFSPDGRLVASASQDHKVKVTEVDTGRDLLTPEHCIGAVHSRALPFSPDGRFLASGNEFNRIELWDVATGAKQCVEAHSKESPLDTVTPVTSIAFSPDGRILASARDNVVTLWDMTNGKVGEQIRVLTTNKPNRLYAMAFSPDGRLLASAGENQTVNLWDVASGKQVGTFSGHTSEIFSLSFNNDGSRLASASGDGSIRIWDASTGGALALLSTMQGSSDWVVVTPEGLFDGSEEGTQRLVAWRVGNRVYPPDRFFADYYTPGLLARVLAGEHPKPNVDVASLKLPPEVRVSVPSGGASMQQHVVATLEAEDQGGGVAEVRLYQNGNSVGTRPGAAGAKSRYEFEVDLVPGENKLEASALSRDRVASNRGLVSLTYQATETKRPALYLLVVGINDYEDQAFHLGFARPDAEAIAGFFEQHGKLFSSVHVVKLFDKEATKAKIGQALRQLAENAQSEDLVLIYMAGHGVGLGQQFYFLSGEMRTEEDEEAAIRKYGIAASLLGNTLLSVKALKQVLILDTCQSGSALPLLAKVIMTKRGLGATEEKAVKMLARSNGFYLIAASTAQQYAYEVPELGHGVLTYALLSGLGEKGKPQAPTGAEGMVTMYSLLQYVNQRVPELTEKYYQGNKQYPVSSNTGMDFPLWVH